MTSRATVPAVDHALRILTLLARSRGPLPASRIAATLELPRSTVYHLLATLEEHAYVLHLTEDRRYGLGIGTVELSSAYSRQEPLAQLGRPLVAALVDHVEMSGHLAIAQNRDVLYVVEERAAGAPSLVTDVDVRLPMEITASGRAILSAYPRAHVRALFPESSAFAHRHRDSDEDSDEVDSYAKLRAILDQTARQGYAVERGSVTPGFWSVGVPVIDHRGWPVAAIAITFPQGRLGEAELPALAATIQRTAGTLSGRIHGRLR